jgi:hypothetical protein
MVQFRKPLSFSGANVANDTLTNLGVRKAFRGVIHGLTLSNNVSDATNDIDIAAGVTWENGDDVPLILTGGLTKRLDAGHSAGTNQGGLDTGSKANSTTYHVHLIGRSDTEAIDASLSTNASTPSLASAWDWNRRVGSIITDGSGVIRPFVQYGDWFLFKSPVTDANAAALGTSASLFTLTVPAGLQVQPIFAALYAYKASVTMGAYVSSPDQTDLAVSQPNTFTHGSTITGAAGGPLTPFYTVFTNTSRQIRARCNTASSSIDISTAGWIDTRGKVA